MKTLYYEGRSGCQYVMQERFLHTEGMYLTIYRLLPDDEYWEYYMGRWSEIYVDSLKGNRWLLIQKARSQKEAGEFLQHIIGENNWQKGVPYADIEPLFVPLVEVKGE